MAVYNLLLKPSVEKDLNKIPSYFVRLILKKTSQLAAQPLPPQSVKLAGADHYYRIRVGDYRIVYEVDPALRQVVVHYVRHRRDVYRSL